MDQVSKVFCSACGRQAEELSANQGVVDFLVGEIEDRELVIKITEQDNGSLFVALFENQSVDAYDLHNEIQSMQFVESVVSVDGGLMVNPSLLSFECGCGAVTNVEWDSINSVDHISYDLKHVIEIMCSASEGDTLASKVRDLVKSMGFEHEDEILTKIRSIERDGFDLKSIVRGQGEKGGKYYGKSPIESLEEMRKQFDGLEEINKKMYPNAFYGHYFGQSYLERDEDEDFDVNADEIIEELSEEDEESDEDEDEDEDEDFDSGGLSGELESLYPNYDTDTGNFEMTEVAFTCEDKELIEQIKNGEIMGSVHTDTVEKDSE